MSKTKPIGVRFDEDLLSELKEKGVADSPQKALNYLMGFYRERQGINGAVRHIDELPVSTTPGSVTKEDIAQLAISLSKVEKREMAKPVPPPGLKGIDLSIWRSENLKGL